MNLKEFTAKRKRLQSYTWYGLPLVVIGGWFYPKLGFLLMGCMIGALGIAAFKGRQWCDWLCPRGSFYDLFLDRISRKKTVPPFFRAKSTRIGMILLLFTVLGVQIAFAWPSVDGIGKAFVIVLTVTTSIGIVFGIGIHPRTWCHVCPMGTIANWMSSAKKPLTIADSCIDCTLCAKVCPMQIAPYRDKAAGTLRDNDCIKCGTCVAACPKQSLSFMPDNAN